MENLPHESIDIVFGCVIPYIHDGDDRNAVSLVCRKWYELDCLTRKHLTVHLPYSPEPSRLHQRFPFIESLTLQGFPFKAESEDQDIAMSDWIFEISFSYKCLKALHVRVVYVFDWQLKLLAITRGKDLRLLNIFSCYGFSTDGLIHIGKYCTHLKSLSLKRNELDVRDGEWFHELALHNSSIESLDLVLYRRSINIDVNDLTLLARNCSQSLVSFKLIQEEIDLVDFFRYAVRLEEVFVSDYVNVGIKFPPNVRCVRMFELTKSTFQLLLPFAHQLIELQIESITLEVDSQCFLIQRCPNLEVLYLPYLPYDNVDEVLQAIGQFCKKLRKLSAWLSSWMGLIAVAQGCINLECLNIGVSNIKDFTSENFERIGTYLKNLRDFTISTCYYKTTIPLDDGVRLMLIGCSKLERLEIDVLGGALTDVGLGYIGKYGHSLKYLSLRYQEENGLEELSKGCPKLRELKLTDYPYHPVNDKVCSMFNIHSLRYVWGCDKCFSDFVLTRHSLEVKDLINDS